MGKRKWTRKKMRAPECVYMSRYTPEAYLRCFPGATMEDYQEQHSPYCYSDFLLDAANTAEKDGIDVGSVHRFRTIVVDDGYFSWLEREGKEDSLKSRAAYDLPDEKAQELLEKYHLDRDYHVMALPLVAVLPAGGTRYSLSKATADTLRLYLGRIYGKDNVWFPGYIMAADALREAMPKLLGLCSAYFEEGVKASVEAFRSSEAGNSFDMPDVMTLFIPFAIKGSIKKACMTRAELEDAFAEKVNAPDMYNYDFIGSGIQELVQADLGVKAKMRPSCINADAVELYLALREEGMYGMV